jgi:polysaccharide biosynthesis/export protein
MIRSAAVLILSAALACGFTEPSRAAGQGVSALRVGDHVNVVVYNHPELSGERTVDSDGTITIPIAGAVAASGSDPRAVAQRMQGALRKYIPLVAVDVQRKFEGASITIAGWPYSIADGVAKYLPGQTLAGVIASIRTSGGSATGQPSFDPFHSALDMRAVRVERDGRLLGNFDLVRMGGRGESGPVLRPGDVVRFVEKPIGIRVLGAVARPGYAHLALDETLSDAIDQVGGLSDAAATGTLILRRGNRERSFSTGDPEYRAPAEDGDILVVPVAPQVLVGGVVLKPGTLALKSDASLLSAVFNAGGPDRDSDLSHVKVIRHGLVSEYDLTALPRGVLSQNPQLRDGDEVFVPRGRRIDPTVFASIVSSLRWFIFK